MQPPFSPDFFRRQDERADALFYAQPRLVNHIDEFAIAAVGRAYRDHLPPGGDYLDLMSSWVSHFPADLAVNSLTGHGMNEEELRRNSALSSYFVQDLNLDPILPFEAARFDGVVICVSVQYLTRPVEVFSEIGRVLKPGCPLIVAFSNRCFPTKAVQAWLERGDAGHADLIATYARKSGRFQPVEVHDYSPARTPDVLPANPELRWLIAQGQLRLDPLYAAVAHRLPG